jgi:hypothetical protein
MTWRSRVVRWLVELVVAAWLGGLTAMVAIHSLHSPPIAPAPVACPQPGVPAP